jgi:hypothetical protein
MKTFDPVRHRETVERLKLGRKPQFPLCFIESIDGDAAKAAALRPSGLSRVSPSQAKPAAAIASGD